MQDFEKLGMFYLGRVMRESAAVPADELLLYDSRDLLTHAVCMGMTGSGKTGLCLGLLEEAAIDGIPAIAIDPKGDLANLMLTFPGLTAQEFLPWINEEEALRAGITPGEFAQRQSDLWKKGLAEWGQDGARIRRLQQAAEVAVYTPGSSAGRPLSVLKSLAAPEAEVREDAELLGDWIRGTVTSLLGLLNLPADPLQSREHILLCQILKQQWSRGKDVELSTLIPLIQNPPVTRVGVLELESFFPSRERFELAMRLNNLLAAPGLEAWLEGEPLDIDSLLRTPEGKARIAILSIAHLADAERMFFVSLLLNRVLGWVRRQSGTTSLRALLYMDEIFGFFPPVANPPSKAPLLSLLKQARAFGLGILLATQNPVDLDYKGLSNAGTWLIGRLQTERDKLRVLEGLEGAAAATGTGFDRQRMEQVLSGLGKRVFLMHNVHEDQPLLFQTRWTLSYLRGPLTRTQIRRLMADRKALPEEQRASVGAVPPPAPMAAPAPAAEGSGAGTDSAIPPVLPTEIPQFFLPVRSAAWSGETPVFVPRLLAAGSVYFLDKKLGVDVEQKASFLSEMNETLPDPDWQNAEALPPEEVEMEKEAPEKAVFGPLPAALGQVRSYAAWKKSFTDFLYRTRKMELWRSPSLEQVSAVEESERSFRLRLNQSMREERDRQKEALRQKYAPKLTALEEKMRRARQAAEREKMEVQQQTFQTAISIGSTLLGAFLGRRTVSMTNINRAASSIRSAGRTWKESRDAAYAEESLEALQLQAQELESQFQAEVQALESSLDPMTEPLETVTLKPKKADIRVSLLALVWTPCRRDGQGNLSSLRQ